MIYDSSRFWNIVLTNIVFTNNNGHWLYLKVPTAEDDTSSELFVSEAHHDPLRDDGYIIYKWGWVYPVVDGKRKVALLFGNAEVGIGEKGDKGDKGDSGDEGDPGPGVAAGGTTGQKLVKQSDTNFDTEWIDDEPGFPATITSETDNAVFEEDGIIKHTHKMGKVDVHNVEQKLKRGTGLLYPSFITQLSGDKSISSSVDWIVPTKEIFENLLNSIDVPNEAGNIWPLAGGKLKEAELTLWDIPNEGATNDYGFNGTPTATRFPWGQFANYRSMGRLWTSSVYVEGVASYFLEYDKDNSAVTLSYAQCTNGCGIRLCNPSTLLAEGQVGSYTQNNGKVVPTKVINGVEWTTRNIDETMFLDGTYIRGFDNNVYTPISNSEWSANAGEGMLCSFNDDTEIAFGLDQKTLLQLFAEKQDSLTADSDYLTPETAAQTYAPISAIQDFETFLDLILS